MIWVFEVFRRTQVLLCVDGLCCGDMICVDEACVLVCVDVRRGCVRRGDLLLCCAVVLLVLVLVTESVSVRSEPVSSIRSSIPSQLRQYVTCAFGSI